jgi:DNA-binding IclR family transcriptional regulator
MHPLIDEVATKDEVCSLAIPDRKDVVFVARASPACVFSTDLDIGIGFLHSAPRSVVFSWGTFRMIY